MTSKKEISDLTLRFQARTLNIYRKLFFDLQERDYSVELRDRAAKLAKAVKETALNKSITHKTTEMIFFIFFTLFLIFVFLTH